MKVDYAILVVSYIKINKSKYGMEVKLLLIVYFLFGNLFSLAVSIFANPMYNLVYLFFVVSSSMACFSAIFCAANSGCLPMVLNFSICVNTSPYYV